MNFALGFETGAALTYDTDGDGLPDWWTNNTSASSERSKPAIYPRRMPIRIGDGLTNRAGIRSGTESDRARCG